MAVTVNPAILEKQFNTRITICVYAVFEDIERNWNGIIKYSPLSYQTYQNLQKDKKLQGDGLKSRFTISDPVRQFMAHMFYKMIEELNNIECASDDTLDVICDKLNNANSDCYSTFLFGLNRGILFGKTLASVSDTTNWFGQQIAGQLPKYAGNLKSIAIIITIFNDSIKAISWLYATLHWYHEITFSADIFQAIMAMRNMPQILIDELCSSLRLKTPKKVAVKSKAKDALMLLVPMSIGTPVGTPVGTPNNVHVAGAPLVELIPEPLDPIALINYMLDSI